MAIVDLHVHSNKSDGEYAPAKVVKLAAEAGLCVMALTDHDNTDGVEEAIRAAAEISAAADPRAAANPSASTGESAENSFTLKATGITCIPGIEITTAHAREQHILGYFIDYKSQTFQSFTRRLMEMRQERANNIIEYLKKHDVPIGYEQTKRMTRSGYIGRPQIASTIVSMGRVGSIRDAFLKYLTGEEFRKVPRPKPTAMESIAQIRAAGGVAVLAHPYSIGLYGRGLSAHLNILKAQGLQGIECHYGAYNPAQTNHCIQLAESLGLIVTGGSDFHGPRIKSGVRIATGIDEMLDFNDLAVVSRLKAAAESRPL
jgi:predicted metal-dependent phosphoesterase TrpH